MVENDRRVRDVVEQRFHGGVEQRQPVLDAEMPASGGNRLVERILVRRCAEQFAIAGAEARDRLLVQRHFADRLDRYFLELVARALGGRVEGADGIQLVTEEIQAHRVLHPGREDVEDAAAYGELARFHHGLRAQETLADQEPGQFLGVDALAEAQEARRAGEGAARRHPLEDGGNGGQDHPTRYVFRRCL